jgi:hypothetical protein
MILTARRPDLGLRNGRDVLLCRDAQASLSISAFRLVLSDLYGSFCPRKYACRTKKLSSL